MKREIRSQKPEAREHAPRGIPAMLAAGIGLTLIAALGLLRLGGWVSPPRGSGMALEGAVHPAVQLPVQPGSTLPVRLPPATTALVPLAHCLRNLETTLVSIRSEQDGLRKNEMLESLAHEMAPADLPAAIEFLNDQDPSSLTRDLKLRLLRQWAGADPPAAAAWLSRTSIGSAEQEALNAVAIVWANQNLSDAAAWVRQWPEEESRNSGLRDIAYEAARTVPLEAIELARQLPAGEARDNLIVHAATQWAAQAPAAAAEWASQITDAALRERVLTEVATAWGASDPTAAAELAMKSLPPGRPQDDAVIGIVQRWVQQKPEDAAAWVTEFPAGPLQDTALEELVKLWADQNLEAPGNWLNRLVLGSARDVAVGAFVTKIAPAFPELGARWAKEIGDEPLRLRELEAVGEAWMATDAAAARAWITQVALPETTKIRLLASKSE